MTARTKALLVQVRLDRAGFSVGEIDGSMGAKTQKALAAFRRARKLPESSTPARSAVVDPDTMTALGEEPAAPTTEYQIIAQDVAGPFATEIPKKLEDQGQLEALAYTSPIEALAERFHTSPTLLRRLNVKAKFAEGETIQVPDVMPAVFPVTSERRLPDKAPARAPDASNGKPAVGKPAVGTTPVVIVSKANNDLRLESATGEVMFYAPVSSGSEHDPLPIGEWKVTDVYLLPKFHYDPELFWDADTTDTKTQIAPGPNSPVGVVWIDIDREHYGLHGTPQPSTVGVTQSHGCVRLTNWDVMRLVALVGPGTRVVFEP